MSTHYTTLLATAPVLALVLLTKSLSARARAATGAVVVVVGLALLPLMIEQVGSGRQEAISPFARLTGRNLLSILGTPWDSRLEDPVGYQVLAAAVTIGGIAWLLGRGSRAGRAIALGAVGPVLASIVATLVSDDAIITRYTAVSAPFALVAIAAAATALPGLRRALAVALVLLVAASGTWRGHDRDARFADARAVTAAIESDWRPTDVIVTPVNDVTVNLPMLYYAGRELPPGVEVIGGEEDARLRAALARRSRVWVVGRDHEDTAEDLAGGLAQAGYEARAVGRYRGTVPLLLTVGTPRPRAR
jgi:hypothetical protein